MAYIAPEQTGRMNRSIDSRADLYALGVTLYQMLTGDLPFEQKDVLSLIHAHLVKIPEPPHLRQPARRIPQTVSAIVQKLLAKNPEQRYQTADGLAVDLERAAQEWNDSESVSAFALGTCDWEDRIRFPSRLFGRDTEGQKLQAAWAQARGGAVCKIIVSGPSGVGKSALLDSLRQTVKNDQGIYAAGKFDELQRNVPYAGLAQALRLVVKRRLAESTEVLQIWQQAWQQAAGNNGRILHDLIPELAHLLPAAPPLSEVGPLEARQRFITTVQRFVRTLARPSHPFLLVIDDLQWADLATLQLLPELLGDAQLGHMLFVGAYRSEELTSEHPLHLFLKTLREQADAAEPIVLEALDFAALTALVADMLDQPAAELAYLVQLLKEKTDGSPFFVEQFLKHMHAQKVLYRDKTTGRWQWDRQRIASLEMTDNVVELLTKRLQSLPQALQTVLQNAACIGSPFDCDLLASLHDLGFAQQALQPIVQQAVEEGLIEPLFQPSKHAEQESYFFVHDRIAQAAYEACPLSQRLLAHLFIGRQLRARTSGGASDDALFAMLYHRNRALTLLCDVAEKQDLAAQNLQAAERAIASTAYAKAIEFLKNAQFLLEGFGWNKAPELTLEVHLALAQALTLCQKTAEGERIFQQCLDQAPNDIERARVASVCLPLYLLNGQYALAFDLALTALAWLGRPLPATPEAHGALLQQLQIEVEPHLLAMSNSDWKNLPASRSKEHTLVCTILEDLIGPSGMIQPSLSPCCGLAIVAETLRHGVPRRALFGFAATALYLTYVQGKLAVAGRVVDATLALMERTQTTKTLALATIATSALYKEPLPYVRELLLRTERIAQEEGHLIYCDGGVITNLYVELLASTPLARMAQILSATVCQYDHSKLMQRILHISIAALSALPDKQKAEAETAPPWMELAEGSFPSPFHTFYAGAMASFVALHLGQDDAAKQIALRIEPLWPASWGHVPLILLSASLCITLILASGKSSETESDSISTALRFHEARLRSWAENCPTTFGHMRLLLDACRAQSLGQAESAAELYDAAIADANRFGHLHGEALALRLAGEHFLAQGKQRSAKAYLVDAHQIYLRWGALAAAAAIRARHSLFFPVVVSDGGILSARDFGEGQALTETLNSHTTTTGSKLHAQLDVASMLGAAQALASDRVLSSLLERLLRLLTENAGATRAVLTLSRQGQLRVVAQFHSEEDKLDLQLDEPAESSSLLPGQVIKYVERSLESVVLGQATADLRFEQDPYLSVKRPASVLAVPLVHQARLLGVIYLEHAKTGDAFAVARVELVRLLAGQAATAVENAQLYAEVRRQTEALQHANDVLEQQVQQRTAELRITKEAADAANRAKSDFLASMSHELRTPLNGILGYAQILERSPTMEAKDKEGVRIIRRSGEHLLTLINDVLDLAKIEAGKLEITPAPLHLASFLQTVVDMCKVRAEQKGLRFVYERSGVHPEVVLADEKRLLQVFLNLLGNAIKFTAQGTVAFRIDATQASADSQTCELDFQIQDTGPGIAQKELGRLFVAFEQLGNRQAQAEGTGLGLSISKKIVTLMNGTIAVHSELGQGSRFVVHLKLRKADGAAPNPVAVLGDVCGYKGPRHKLLVVDDHADNRAVIRDLLCPIGFEVLEAQSGQEALSLALAHRPALVLMDLLMPEMTGYTATRNLLQQHELASTIVIACSASMTQGERQRSAAAGCKDYLSKPVAAPLLFALLQKHLHLEWVYKEAAAPPSAAVETTNPVEPAAQERARLLDLANRGRLRDLQQQIDVLEQRDPRLSAWATALRTLIQNFQIKKIREVLQADA